MFLFPVCFLAALPVVSIKMESFACGLSITINTDHKNQMHIAGFERGRRVCQLDTASTRQCKHTSIAWRLKLSVRT
jgi:hypothetical protein